MQIKKKKKKSRRKTSKAVVNHRWEWSLKPVMKGDIIKDASFVSLQIYHVVNLMKDAVKHHSFLTGRAW